MCVSLLFVLILCIISSCLGFSSSNYTNSKVIEPLDYTVYWRVDLSSNALYLALRVKTTGWVGFGIAELTSGSMPGADIIVGSVVNGVGTVTDRYASEFSFPPEDECQDVTLIAAEETDGYTIIEVKRPIHTTDSQDHSVVKGPNRIIVAYGDSDTFGYHSRNRKTGEIIFFGSPLYTDIPVDNEKTIDLRMNNYLVPNEKTRYACQTFPMPTDAEYTITQIDPIVNESNVAHVHHFLAHVCFNQSIDGETPLVNYYSAPSACDTPLGAVFQGCVGLLTAWASGGGSTYTPEDVGFAMGINPSAIKFIILEVHYNNPSGIGGYIDNSGIRIHYSTTPRKYEADVMTLGDPFVNEKDIPAGLSSIEYEMECSSDCTQTFDHDITVFQSFPHMHQVGSQIWTSQWRDGKQIDDIGRVEYWVFDHQLVQEENVTIKKGDRLNTHCVYNTKGLSSPVKFGIASTDEMCMHFVTYYPRLYSSKNSISLPFSFCGKLEGYGSVCGSAFDVNTIANPTTFDPPGGINKTFGPANLVCQITPPSSAPTSAPPGDQSDANSIFVSSLFILTFFFCIL